MFSKVIYLSIFLPLFLYSNECLVCHKNKLNQCKKSNHFTLKNSINITRGIWGISDSNVTLQTLPKPKNHIKTTMDLVDDFLRRKCLRCHLESNQINSTNNICLACHNKHNNSKDSYKAKPVQSKCIKCHNGEFIGGDYQGLFPHDYDKAYRTPITQQGYYPKRTNGIDHHHLIEDIHFQKGLRCVDCHKNKDKKSWETKVDCKSCHINISQQNHKNYHKKISCSACHSGWNISSYELNVLRDDTPNYIQWKRLKVQEDIYLENFLTKVLKNKNNPKPKMPDYVDNKLKDGIWYSGWLFRRWENFFLVNSDDGKIKIAKPMFQYHISYKNKKGDMVLDDVSKINGKKLEAFLPKEPHTIIKKAKSCQMCHNNKIMLDDNLINKSILKGRILKGKPLSNIQLKQLQSDFYKQERYRVFMKEGLK